MSRLSAPKGPQVWRPAPDLAQHQRPRAPAVSGTKGGSADSPLRKGRELVRGAANVRGHRRGPRRSGGSLSRHFKHTASKSPLMSLLRLLGLVALGPAPAVTLGWVQPA